MMDFHWKQIAEHEYHLYGYETEKIAILKYNNNCEIWELTSRWLNNSDVANIIDCESVNIQDIQLNAIEMLTDACNEQIEWYKNQISMLNELHQDMISTKDKDC